MSKYYKAEDVIRKRAEDLADTSYWEYGNPKNVDDWIEIAEMEFEGTPTVEVSEDCISREVATDIVKNYDFKFPQYMERFVTELRDAMKKDLIEDIKNAPSVVPSRAEGEWYRQTTDHFDYWECSECGIGVGLDDIKNYCPNCGAKMKGYKNEQVHR